MPRGYCEAVAEILEAVAHCSAKLQRLTIEKNAFHFVYWPGSKKAEREASNQLQLKINPRISLMFFLYSGKHIFKRLVIFVQYFK